LGASLPKETLFQCFYHIVEELQKKLDPMQEYLHVVKLLLQRVEKPQEPLRRGKEKKEEIIG